MTDIIKTPLDIAARVSEAYSSLEGTSLAETTALTRLMPTVAIDSILTNSALDLNSLLQTTLSLITADYVRAINLDLISSEAKHILDKYAMTKMNAGKARSVVGDRGFIDTESLTLDASPNFDAEALTMGEIDLEAVKPEERRALGTAVDVKSKINEETNLAVGKMIELKFQLPNSKDSVTIPVSAQLNTIKMSPSSFKDIVDFNHTDKTWKGRYHQLRAGQIGFWEDFIGCQDLIAKDRKALRADKDGILSAERSKRANGFVKSILSGKVTPHLITSTFIISKETAKSIEGSLKGSLTKMRTRDKFFKDLVAAMLIVVDPVTETFNVYNRGIDEYGTYTFDDIRKNGSRANGVDIKDVMQAYRMGNAPTL